MNIEKMIEAQDFKIAEAEANKIFLRQHADFLAAIEASTFFVNRELNFQNLDREQTLAVLRHFRGKFDKTYRGAQVDYVQRTDNWLESRAAIYGGTPPDTCRIVEEEVEIPARKEIRRRVVCQQEEVTA